MRLDVYLALPGVPAGTGALTGCLGGGFVGNLYPAIQLGCFHYSAHHRGDGRQVCSVHSLFPCLHSGLCFHYTHRRLSQTLWGIITHGELMRSDTNMLFNVTVQHNMIVQAYTPRDCLDNGLSRNSSSRQLLTSTAAIESFFFLLNIFVGFFLNGKIVSLSIFSILFILSFRMRINMI